MKPGLTAITLFAALAVGATASATIMVPLDLKALTTRADRVVYGAVEGSETHWTAAHDAIYTDVTVRVLRSYKGTMQPGETVVVRREGGVVDGVEMRVYGSPTFQPTEEVVVFLEKRGAASYVVGMAQGKLRVTTLVDGTKRVSAPDTRGISYVKGTTPVTMRARPLDELERDLRSLVQP
jgi:hypothetical protein